MGVPVSWQIGVEWARESCTFSRIESSVVCAAESSSSPAARFAQRGLDIRR
jgi:hypothetical protein